MIKANDTSIGYWVDPNENTEGVIDLVLDYANPSQSTLSGTILPKLKFLKKTIYNDRLTLMIKKLK